jgi:very-short-patch-repair endonuclease
VRLRRVRTAVNNEGKLTAANLLNPLNPLPLGESQGEDSFMLPYPRKQKTFARRLRRTQTDAERKLWLRLRDRQLCGAKFRRQHPIGPFLTDFCCMEIGLVVELDGSQHRVRALKDQKRSLYLQQRGYRILRFWDNEVLTNTDAVLEQIVRVLNRRHPNRLPIG